MYTIYGKQVGASAQLALHNPNLEQNGNVCISPVMSERLNSAGSLRFSIAPKNPYYETLKSRRTYVTVYSDSAEVWRGRVMSARVGWNKLKQVECEGEMSYLLDTIKYPFVFHGSPSDLLQNLLSNHNAYVGTGDERRFSVGTVTVNDTVDISTTSPMTTWDVISKFLLSVLGGYVRTRKSNGTVYLDYLADFTAESGQNVEFGKNMLDLTQAFDADSIITDLIPFGAQKNTAPKLFKLRSGYARTYDLFTGDIEAGTYLIVANGAAMNKTLSSGKLQSDLVTIQEDSGGNQYIVLPEGSSVIPWQIVATTVQTGESASLTGSITENVTVTDNNGVVIGGYTRSINIGGQPGDGLVIGGGDNGVSSGSVSTSGSSTGTIGTNQNISATSSGSIGLSGSSSNGIDGWLIRNGSSYIAGDGHEGRIAIASSQSGKNTLWKISNGENGATITNQRNSDDKVGAVLHGDVDYGFWCAPSAGGNREPPTSGAWDGNRVNINRVNSGDWILHSADALALWGAHVYGTVTFNDAQTPQELLTLAQDYLINQFAEHITIECKAADLSLISLATDSIEVGTYANVVSAMHDLDIRLLCREKNTALTQPDKTTITFGAGQKTLTDLQGGLITDVRYN